MDATRLLIVDDSPEDRFVVRHLLEADPLGSYEFHESDKGWDGLDAARRIRPDCVLLDYRLPDMDGIQFLNRIRGQRSDTPFPIVLLTGSGDENVAVAAMRAGAQDYVSKRQIDPEKLGRAVRGCIERFESARIQRAHERQLAQAGEQLRLAFAAAGAGAWEWEVGTDHATWSPECFGLFGLDASRGAPPYATWLERCVHPDDRARVAREVRIRQSEGPDEFRLEFRTIHPAKGVRWMMAPGRVDRGNGRAGTMSGLFIDLTERRAAEAALRESEERFRRVVDTHVFGFAIAAATGRVSYVNDAFLRLVEVSRADFERDGFDLKALTPPDCAALDAAAEQELRRTGRTRPYEREYQLSSGRRIPVLIAATGLTSDRGTHDHAILVVDLSRQKAAERRLADLNAELEDRVADRTRALTNAARELAAEMQRREEAQSALLQAQKLEALGQLTGGVAHDFNNLVTAISACLRMIAQRTREQAVLDLAGHGEEAAKRAAALVAQLMNFARREQLRPSLVDPAALLRQLEPLLCHSVGSNVSCSIDAEPGIWTVMVDPNRLELALLNLVVNARDAMPAGGRIVASLRNRPADGRQEAGDFVALTVSDNGTGMSPEVLARAAEPFFTTKPAGQGTGLGLAMVQDLARLSGGRLEIESAPGNGTRVAIVLRRAAEPDGQASVPPDAAGA